MVTQKKSVLNFFGSQFLTQVSVEADFMDQFLGCIRSSYAPVNTVPVQGLDTINQQINNYPVDECWMPKLTDLRKGQRCPPFELLRPGLCTEKYHLNSNYREAMLSSFFFILYLPQQVLTYMVVYIYNKIKSHKTSYKIFEISCILFFLQTTIQSTWPSQHHLENKIIN